MRILRLTEKELIMQMSVLAFSRVKWFRYELYKFSNGEFYEKNDSNIDIYILNIFEFDLFINPCEKSMGISVLREKRRMEEHCAFGERLWLSHNATGSKKCKKKVWFSCQWIHNSYGNT